jgi:hypothetical protein
MPESVVIERRFCGPPNSGNGGYVCGLIAKHIEGSAEITLRAPPPLDRPLNIVAGTNGGLELRENERLLAIGRAAPLSVAEIPIVTFAEAEEAASRTPVNERNHQLPTCFVCGTGRAHGDGLRILAGPLLPASGTKPVPFASPWIPYAYLAAKDGLVASEFVWASLDCPTGFAGASARHLGMSGGESILLGRMHARIDQRPRPGERCVIVAWPTGREGRKLFAEAVLLGPNGECFAVSRATWLVVDRATQLGEAG